MTDLEDLRVAMSRFTRERGWERFHDPKSLTLALMGEVGELAELLQWQPGPDLVVRCRRDPLQTRLAEEMADVLLLYLVRLADVVGVDLGDAAAEKLADSVQRFPVNVFRDRAPES